MAIVISVFCDKLYCPVETADDTQPVVDPKARYWSKIAILPLSEYCHNVLNRKTRMVRLPDGERIFEDRIHERHRQTDRHTPHDGTGRTYA